MPDNKMHCLVCKECKHISRGKGITEEQKREGKRSMLQDLSEWNAVINLEKFNPLRWFLCKFNKMEFCYFLIRGR